MAFGCEMVTISAAGCRRIHLPQVEDRRKHEDEMMPAEVQQRLLHLHIIRDNVSAELRRQ